MAKRYALKGVNDEATECCVCGKVELKRVMWLVELDSDGNEAGAEFHCGTTCGAKLLGQKIGKVRKAVDNFDSEVRMRRFMIGATHPAYLASDKINSEILKEVGFARRKEHPRYAEMMTLRAEAEAAAEAAVITIEIE